MFNLKLFKKILLFFLLPLIGLLIINTYAQAQLNDQQIANNCIYHEEIYQDLDSENLKDELETNGIIGNIHGAVSDYNLFVLSVRNPQNFFDHREFSLVSDRQEITDQLATLKRHDQVCIQGRFLRNPSPQKHILIKNLTIQESYNNGVNLDPYQRDVNLPQEIIENTSFIGKVHIVNNEGEILVVEYKDLVIPVYVKAPELTKDLYRGDIIKLHYTIQSKPQKPTHLRLNLREENPIEIIDSLKNWHSQEKTLTGKLVQFPKSPQVKFDVYALEIETDNIKRYFTLVNFQNPEEFIKIREKLSQIWNNHQDTIISGRNMLINPDLIMTATGIINVESPQQANPQILLENSDYIRLFTQVNS